jgi:rhodanese-related sulfurtransferase
VRTLALLAALLVQDDPVDYTKDSLEKIKAAVEKKEAVLLDVREESEWKAGHLKIATFVPLSWLRNESAEAVAGKVPKGKIIYAHCRAGGRAMTAAGILKKMGYEVRPLKQGYEELKKNLEE